MRPELVEGRQVKGRATFDSFPLRQIVHRFERPSGLGFCYFFGTQFGRRIVAGCLGFEPA
jgi:hypothetical protein